MIQFSSINQNSTFAELLELERKEFALYQHHDFLDYQKQRLAFLEKHLNSASVKALHDYVKTNQPKIGVFAGSFSPFHKGHYRMSFLQKAEKLFDKVIIAFGKNPAKDVHTWPVPKTISNRQITSYNSLLTDHMNLGYDVTVVRGLNSTDFQYEQNQYRYIQELKPDIKIINIFCDKEFEHISSSGIRTL